MEDETNYNIKLSIYNDELDLSINSDYNYFVKNICQYLNIPSDKLNTLVITYIDEDGDSILLSTEEDYKIFYYQVKQHSVNKIIVEINENQKEEKKKEEDNKEEILEISNNFKSDNNNINLYDSNNNINNESNKINNKYNCIEHKNSNNDVPIDNLIFEYECSNCKLYPIICVMFYCDKCNLYLCEECEKKKKGHDHPLLKIEKKDQLLKIKDKENKELEQKIVQEEKKRIEEEEKRIQQQYNNYYHSQYQNDDNRNLQINNDYYNAYPNTNYNNYNYNQERHHNNCNCPYCNQNYYDEEDFGDLICLIQ